MRAQPGPRVPTTTASFAAIGKLRPGAGRMTGGAAGAPDRAGGCGTAAAGLRQGCGTAASWRRGYGEGMRIVVKAVLALAALGAALSVAGAVAERMFVKAREDGRM